MNIEKKIVEILGDKQTKPAVFNDKLEVTAIYTWKGNVYCLFMGKDFPLSEVSEKGQINILNAIRDKKYKIIPSCIG